MNDFPKKEKEGAIMYLDSPCIDGIWPEIKRRIGLSAAFFSYGVLRPGRPDMQAERTWGAALFVCGAPSAGPMPPRAAQDIARIPPMSHTTPRFPIITPNVLIAAALNNYFVLISLISLRNDVIKSVIAHVINEVCVVVFTDKLTRIIFLGGFQPFNHCKTYTCNSKY